MLQIKFLWFVWAYSKIILFYGKPCDIIFLVDAQTYDFVGLEYFLKFKKNNDRLKLVFFTFQDLLVLMKDHFSFKIGSLFFLTLMEFLDFPA